jgi:hypothetical protein
VVPLGDNTALSLINEYTDFTCAQSLTHLENITPSEQLFARVTVNNHIQFAETSIDCRKVILLYVKDQRYSGQQQLQVSVQNILTYSLHGAGSFLSS